jgi:hypothetical protein
VRQGLLRCFVSRASSAGRVADSEAGVLRMAARVGAGEDRGTCAALLAGRAAVLQR